MKLLVDMNLSPEWQTFLSGHGLEAIHWSTIGAPNAPDEEIMRWARDHGYIVLTHDLDFGILLAYSKDHRPSVVQARTQDVAPTHLGSTILTALRTYKGALEEGAILTVDEARARIRLLPI